MADHTTRDVARILSAAGLHAEANLVSRQGTPPCLPGALQRQDLLLAGSSAVAVAVLRLVGQAHWHAVRVVLSDVFGDDTLPLLCDWPSVATVAFVAGIQRAVLSWQWSGARPSADHDAVIRQLFPSVAQVAPLLAACDRATAPAVKRVLSRMYAQIGIIRWRSAWVDARLSGTLFDQDPLVDRFAELYSALPVHLMHMLPLQDICQHHIQTMKAVWALVSQRPDVDWNQAGDDGNPVWFGLRGWLLPALAAQAKAGAPLPPHLDLNLPIVTNHFDAAPNRMPWLWHCLAATARARLGSRADAEDSVVELLLLGAAPITFPSATKAPWAHCAAALLRTWRGGASLRRHPLLGSSRLDADDLARAGLRLPRTDVRAVYRRLDESAQRGTRAAQRDAIVEAFAKETRWRKRGALFTALFAAQSRLAQPHLGRDSVMCVLFQRPPLADPACEYRVVSEVGGIVATFLGKTTKKRA